MGHKTLPFSLSSNKNAQRFNSLFCSGASRKTVINCFSLAHLPPRKTERGAFGFLLVNSLNKIQFFRSIYEAICTEIL